MAEGQYVERHLTVGQLVEGQYVEVTKFEVCSVPY